MPHSLYIFRFAQFDRIAVSLLAACCVMLLVAKPLQAGEQVTLNEAFTSDPAQNGKWHVFKYTPDDSSGSIKRKSDGYGVAAVKAATTERQARIGLISARPVWSVGQIRKPDTAITLQLTFADDMTGTGYNQPVTRLTLTGATAYDPHGGATVEAQITLRPSVDYKIRDCLMVKLVARNAAGSNTIVEETFLTAADGQSPIRCGKGDVFEMTITPTQVIAASYHDASEDKTTQLCEKPVSHQLDPVKDFPRGARMAVSHWTNLNDGDETSSAWRRIQAVTSTDEGNPSEPATQE